MVRILLLFLYIYCHCYYFVIVIVVTVIVFILLYYYFYYKENWETIEKKVLEIAKEESDNSNVQKMIALAGSDISESKKFSTCTVLLRLLL